MSEPIELTFKEVELTKLDLQPGQTLAITVKSNDMDGETINSLRDGFRAIFPNNRILIIGLALTDEIKFTAISEIKENSSCATGSFCADCSCGKKEQYESQQ